MKTILLHVQDDPRVDVRVENALALARSCDAHLDVLHVTPDDVAAVFESFGGVEASGDGLKAFEKRECELEERVKKELSNEDVSWEYFRETGSILNSIANHAALADLIVAGRAAHRDKDDDTAIALLGDLLTNSRTPVWLRGDEQERYNPNCIAVIGWDGSFEVANAVRGGISVLQQASEVHVVRVTDKGAEVAAGMYPVDSVLKYLSRNGVHAEYSRIAKVDGKTVNALLDFAEKKGAGLLTVGGYSHSRIGQRLFGGVTRSLLTSCPIALMIAH
ncbi:universal stress protein [Sphingomicrobium sediminis]|uniref:Universal stress protein n=1 Tax=Sphingomicrobium sediminis TaxID=2950949 RepID=A0A9X2EKE3_9SPHN|nr:universal stress protein [Sphingomicrobium sediminis]MCM8558451.1 universal stress protein [Sphingomicrobium sediminis]